MHSNQVNSLLHFTVLHYSYSSIQLEKWVWYVDGGVDHDFSYTTSALCSRSVFHCKMQTRCPAMMIMVFYVLKCEEIMRTLRGGGYVGTRKK